MNFRIITPPTQFLAAAGSIAVIIHTAIGWWTATLPPIEFHSVSITDAVSGGSSEVVTVFQRNRECPFTSWSPEIVGSDGVQYGVKTTLGSALTPPGDDLLSDVYRVVIDPSIPHGPAVYRGQINYACKEGLIVVFYPPDLRLCILRSDGTRPESCPAGDSIQTYKWVRQ